MSHGAHHLPYMREKIEYRAARRKARREHPQPCDCPYCMTAERADALFAQRVAEGKARNPEPPF